MIRCRYNWQTFRRWLKATGESLDGVPEGGCTKELRKLFRERRGLKQRLIRYIRKAPGDRAWTIYCARRDGWWPESTAVADIRRAPGDRAMAIYFARSDGWWPESSAVADIRKAPGRRAAAIYWAQGAGWWPD